ncbi:MAG: globin [Chloroflexi bacterium]|nr:globin [Chloroflexota bacterium]
MGFTPQSIYELIGGDEPVAAIVDAFYDAVESDPVLRPMYPENLDAPRRHLYLFLLQFFGGPRTYLEERGHPRLRMRHFPFAIDQRARDHWLRHMLNAVDQAGIQEPARSRMREYFDRSSTFLINRRSVTPDLDQG